MVEDKKNNRPAQAEQKPNQIPQKTASIRPELEKDKKYQALKAEYQHANWKKCYQLLSELRSRYHDDETLNNFEKELSIQETVYFEEKKIAQQAKNNRSIKKTERTLIVIGLVIIFVTLVCGGTSKLFSGLVQRDRDSKVTQFNLLAGQIESLLISGQPEKTDNLLQELKDIDPDDPRIANYESSIAQLLELNSLYDKALEEINRLEYESALEDLQIIELQKPGYRDVQQLIETTQTRIDIEKSLETAMLAYDQERWQDAIDDFELILALDPAYKDPEMENLLLHSYLKRIIQMLESESTAVADIDVAENYYRKAVAMIPQSRIFLSERENLQEISSSLLELKYTQTALNLLDDPFQNQSTINKAVSYLKKAANLNPQNPILQDSVTKAELYQIGFQYYVQMEWAAAIENLTRLVNLDEDFASGYAKQLLYEAHMGRGTSYFSVGFFLDARKEYEAAEIVAWDMDNRTALFTSEISLGRTLGKLKDYKNAASYFKYAYESIDYSLRAADQPEFIAQIRSAIQLYNETRYQESYELFDEIRTQNQGLFSEATSEIKANTCLAVFAASADSTVQVIQERNDLPRQTTMILERDITVPTLP